MSSYDMSGVVRFDLNRGRVTLRDASGASDEQSSRALLPVDALAALLQQTPPDGVADVGHRIGSELGRRVRERLAGELESADAQTILDHLGGELALLGLGSLKLELWGRALVFALEGSALLEAIPGQPNDPASSLLAALVEGAVARGLGRDAKVLPLQRGTDEARLLVCSASAREQVRGWLSSGCHYGEALARLNETGARA
jgi:hypothetical protein